MKFLPCLPLAPAKAAKGNCMGVTVVGEDDVIGTENNSILVQSSVISMPYMRQAFSPSSHLSAPLPTGSAFAKSPLA